MKKITAILVSLLFTGMLFSQDDNKALKVSDIKGTYQGYLQLVDGKKDNIQWKAIINEDMTFVLSAKENSTWIEQMRAPLTRKRFYEKEGSVYYEFTPKSKDDNVTAISFTILSAHYKKAGNYKGLLLIISSSKGGHLIFDVNRAGGNPTIPAAASKQTHVSDEGFDFLIKSFAVYGELYKMDFAGINKIFSFVFNNYKNLTIEQVKAKFRPVINMFKSSEENAREAEKLTQVMSEAAGKYGCEKKEIEYIRAAKHLRDLSSNLQMAKDKLYTALNNSSERKAIEFFNKSNGSYNDAKDNLDAFFKAEKIAAKTKCVEKTVSSTHTNSNTKPRVTKIETVLKKSKGSIPNSKHSAAHINGLFLEKGGTPYTSKDQKKYPTPSSFPTFEGTYEGTDLFGLLGRHIEDPTVIGFINHYRLKKFGTNQYFKFKSFKEGILVEFEKNRIQSIKLKMNGGPDGNFTKKLPFGVLRTDDEAQIESKLPSRGSYMMGTWATFKIDGFMGTVRIPKANEYWYIYLTFDNGF